MGICRFARQSDVGFSLSRVRTRSLHVSLHAEAILGKLFFGETARALDEFLLQRSDLKEEASVFAMCQKRGSFFVALSFPEWSAGLASLCHSWESSRRFPNSFSNEEEVLSRWSSLFLAKTLERSLALRLSLFFFCVIIALCVRVCMYRLYSPPCSPGLTGKRERETARVYLYVYICECFCAR